MYSHSVPAEWRVLKMFFIFSPQFPLINRFRLLAQGLYKYFFFSPSISAENFDFQEYYLSGAATN